tara:strand:+ start:273 stop:380 length:108 start_codon:yes stop_codon:yes gene_type:complete
MRDLKKLTFYFEKKKLADCGELIFVFCELTRKGRG